VRAYRDSLKLFYLFLAQQKRKPVAELALDDIQSDAVLGFLDHVESRRGNSAVTRNCRLAAVRSFVQHLLGRMLHARVSMGVFLPFVARKLYEGSPLTWNLKKHAP
jgi:site-specific recombinase XerD